MIYASSSTWPGKSLLGNFMSALILHTEVVSDVTIDTDVFNLIFVEDVDYEFIGGGTATNGF